MLSFLKREWLPLLLLLTPTMLVLILWNRLPDAIPIHWNLEGEVNGYQSPITFLWSTLGLNLILYLSTLLPPYIDPKAGSHRLERPLRVIRMVVMAFVALFFSSMLLQSLGYPVDLDLITNLGVILLFLVMGNLMSKFPPNYFAGIRTPWTLEHPEIWRAVHRLAARLWVGGALFLLLFVFRLDNTAYFILFVSVLAVLVLVPVVQSYLLYRRLGKV